MPDVKLLVTYIKIATAQRSPVRRLPDKSRA